MLLRIKHHLEPLAIAANVTQSAFCRLDEVLLTFGSLCMTYTQMMSNGGDVTSCEAIIGSIEKRWKKSDQAPFIAAIILNPLLKATPFQQHVTLTVANIHQLLRSLFIRFFPSEEQPQMFNDIIEYLEVKGNFLPMEGIVNDAKKSRISDVGIYDHYMFCHAHIG